MDILLWNDEADDNCGSQNIICSKKHISLFSSVLFHKNPFLWEQTYLIANQS